MRIDLIIESRNVFTGVGDVARPAAIAVAGDRIVAVGSREDVRAFALEANAGGERARGARLRRRARGSDFTTRTCTSSIRPRIPRPWRPCFWAKARPTAWRACKRSRKTGRTAGFWRKDGANTAGTRRCCRRNARWMRRSPRVPWRCTRETRTLWLNSVALDELGLTRESVPPAGGLRPRRGGRADRHRAQAAAMELMPQIMGSFTDEVADALPRLLRTVG
ncbi:MAG: imidazolonepropionase-like domain-containing protein [Eggerthellaceae bacterium]